MKAFIVSAMTKTRALWLGALPRIGDSADTEEALRPEGFFFGLPEPSGRVSKWAEVGCTQNRSSNDRAITQPLERDKQTSRLKICHSRNFCNSRSSDRRTGKSPSYRYETASEADWPPIALTRQGV